MICELKGEDMLNNTRQIVKVEVIFMVTMVVAMVGPIVEYLVR